MKRIIAAACIAMALSACGGGGSSYAKEDEYWQPPHTAEFKELEAKLHITMAKYEACKCDNPFITPGVLTDEDIQTMIEWATIFNKTEQIGYYRKMQAERIQLGLK